MFRISNGLKAVALGAAVVAWTLPASAAPVTALAPQATAHVAQQADGAITQVQYYRGRRYYRGGYHHHDGAGAAIAAGVGAAVIGGIIASQVARPAPAPDAVQYCLSRYRSYRPETGTYTGFDGYQHPCP
jgi:hypothetical protein